MFAFAQPERQSRVDWFQLLGLLGLMTVGVLFIYSATHARALESIPWHKELFVRQIFWCVSGVALAVVMCLVDYRSMSRWSMVGYWIMIVLLIAVLIPGLGTTRGGARRWFDLKVFLFQPSEFAKLAFIFAFGHFLSRPMEELRVPSMFFKALGWIALPFVLIMKEPDLGSALIFVPTGFMMMMVAGVPRRFLVRSIGIVGVLAALFLVDILFAPPGWWEI
jgi:cell division protein FtsW (lipid II flippase)